MKNVEVTATTVKMFQEALDLIQQIGGQVLDKTEAAQANPYATKLIIFRNKLSGNILELPATVDIRAVEVICDPQDMTYVYRVEVQLVNSDKFADIRVIGNFDLGLKIVKISTPTQ